MVSKKVILSVLLIAAILVATSFLIFLDQETNDTYDRFGKRYVSTDLEECALINYRCGVSEQGFVDETGCGCQQTYACTPTDRQGDICTRIYNPVCGWFNTSEVQCITYPCAQTYGNSCEACHNTQVEYWTPSMCPSS